MHVCIYVCVFSSYQDRENISHSRYTVSIIESGNTVTTPKLSLFSINRKVTQRFNGWVNCKGASALLSSSPVTWEVGRCLTSFQYDGIWLSWMSECSSMICARGNFEAVTSSRSEIYQSGELIQSSLSYEYVDQFSLFKDRVLKMTGSLEIRHSISLDPSSLWALTFIYIYL